MIRTILYSFLFMVSVCIKAQQFTYTYDTIRLDFGRLGLASSYSTLLFGTVFRDMYCFVALGNDACQYLLMTDMQGRMLHKIKVPIDTENERYISALLTRNDSLILKRNREYTDDCYERWNYEYEVLNGLEHEIVPNDMHDYYLDTGSWEIRPCNTAFSAIYEDRRFVALSMAAGEFGSWLLFQEKKHKRLHLFREATLRLFRIGKSYYGINWYGIFKIDKPESAPVVDGSVHHTDYEHKAEYSRGKYIYKTKSGDTSEIMSTEFIEDGFVHGRRLYVVVRTADDLFIARYADERLIPMMSLGQHFAQWRVFTQFSMSDSNRALIKLYNREQQCRALVFINELKVNVIYIMLQNSYK